MNTASGGVLAGRWTLLRAAVRVLAAIALAHARARVFIGNRNQDQAPPQLRKLNGSGVRRYSCRPTCASGRGAGARGTGLRGFKSMALYSATKHAVSGLTRAAPLDCARLGIRINAVAPGPTATPALGPQPQVFASYVPMARLGRPQGVAAAVVWLCSDAASYLTGHVMPVDGGADAACDPANSAPGGNG